MLGSGVYESLATMAKHRIAVPWPFRDRDTYKAHFELGIIRSLIASAPVEHVELDSLYAIQRTVSLARALEYVFAPQLAKGRVNESTGTPSDLPIVVLYGGRRYIHDGHHRLTVTKLSGATTARVRVVDLDAASKPRGGTKVQSLVFDKKTFTRARAVKWAKTHDFKSGDVDETETSYRLRQRDPRRFVAGSFRTVKLASGVSAVIGKLK